MSPSKAHQARCVRLLRQSESQAKFCKVSERKARERDKETLATPASLFPLSSLLSLSRGSEGRKAGAKEIKIMRPSNSTLASPPLFIHLLSSSLFSLSSLSVSRLDDDSRERERKEEEKSE